MLAVPFVQSIKTELAQRGPAAFQRALTFDETDVLQRALPYFKRTLGYDGLELASAADGLKLAKDLEAKGTPDPNLNVAIIEAAQPGAPGVGPPACLLSTAPLTVSTPVHRLQPVKGYPLKTVRTLCKASLCEAVKQCRVPSGQVGTVANPFFPSSSPGPRPPAAMTTTDMRA